MLSSFNKSNFTRHTYMPFILSSEQIRVMDRTGASKRRSFCLLLLPVLGHDLLEQGWQTEGFGEETENRYVMCRKSHIKFVTKTQSTYNLPFFPLYIYYGFNWLHISFNNFPEMSQKFSDRCVFKMTIKATLNEIKKNNI